jgi:hypothetical protein
MLGPDGASETVINRDPSSHVRRLSAVATARIGGSTAPSVPCQFNPFTG